MDQLTQDSVSVHSGNTDLLRNGQNDPTRPTQNFKHRISTRSRRIPKTRSNDFLWVQDIVK